MGSAKTKARANFQRYRLVTAAIIAAIVSLVVFGAKFSQSQKPRQTEVRDEHSQLVEVLRRGGLREAAKLKGHYVIVKRSGWDAIFSDIESLTSHSELVVVGMPTRAESRLSPEGDTILTDYAIDVLDVVKGKVEFGRPITLTLAGGFIKFEDGSSAEVRTPDFQIQVAKVYVFFLTMRSGAAAGIKSFYPTGGPQGVFEIDGPKIFPLGRPIDTVVKKYKAMRSEVFIEQIRLAAAKWPGKPQCCKPNKPVDR